MIWIHFNINSLANSKNRFTWKHMDIYEKPSFRQKNSTVSKTRVKIRKNWLAKTAASDIRLTTVVQSVIRNRKQTAAPLPDDNINNGGCHRHQLWPAKPKGGNCLLKKWAVTAFWFCMASVLLSYRLHHRERLTARKNTLIMLIVSQSD